MAERAAANEGVGEFSSAGIGLGMMAGVGGAVGNAIGGAVSGAIGQGFPDIEPVNFGVTPSDESQAAGRTQAGAKFCPECGRPFQPTDKFCPECGTRRG